jgi:arsenate reductase-like glutaredoxin family protein
LLNLGAELEYRDLDKERLSEDELDKLIGNLDYIQFLNPRNELYRTRSMKDYPPSRSAAIKFMSKNPNLIRRPIIINGTTIILGHDEAAFEKLLQ